MGNLIVSSSKRDRVIAARPVFAVTALLFPIRVPSALIGLMDVDGPAQNGVLQTAKSVNYIDNQFKLGATPWAKLEISSRV